MITVYFDGACEPVNPGGHTSYGFLIQVGRKVVVEGYGYLGVGPAYTNNVGEYGALVYALCWLVMQGCHQCPITVYGDSQLVIQQMRGSWKAGKGLYLPYYNMATQLKRKFSRITFHWIPREQNTRADRLSKKSVKDKPWPTEVNKNVRRK